MDLLANKKKVLIKKRSEASIEESEIFIIEYEENIEKKKLIMNTELEKMKKNMEKYEKDVTGDIERLQENIKKKYADIEASKNLIKQIESELE